MRKKEGVKAHLFSEDGRHSGEWKPNAFLSERVNKPSERRWAWLHRPPFVGRGGEASREQEPLVFAEAGDFSQKSFHAQPFFSPDGAYVSSEGESTRGAFLN